MSRRCIYIRVCDGRGLRVRAHACTVVCVRGVCVCVLQRVACEMCKVSAVGQMGVAIVLFQVFLLTVAYVLMDHEACVSFYSVFSFFAGLQVLNSVFYFFSYLEAHRFESSVKASDGAAVGSLNEALLVAA